MRDSGTSIRVEFYGVPRLRAGVPEAVIRVARVPATLSDVIEQLTREFPELAAECFRGSTLREGYVVNVGGDGFVTAPETRLAESNSLLILSADAGG